MAVISQWIMSGEDILEWMDMGSAKVYLGLYSTEHACLALLEENTYYKRRDRAPPLLSVKLTLIIFLVHFHICFPPKMMAGVE